MPMLNESYIIINFAFSTSSRLLRNYYFALKHKILMGFVSCEMNRDRISAKLEQKSPHSLPIQYY